MTTGLVVHYKPTNATMSQIPWENQSLSGQTEDQLYKIKPILGTIISQEPVARQVLGPRGEPTTITLLIELIIKPTPTDFSLHS